MSTQAYQNDSLTRNIDSIAVNHVVTTAEDTANVAAITVTDIIKITSVPTVQIASTAGVRRVPQGAVTFTGKVVTVNDTGLAVNEVITLIALGYAS